MQLWLSLPYPGGAEDVGFSLRGARGLTVTGDSHVVQVGLMPMPCAGVTYYEWEPELAGLSAGDGTVEVAITDAGVEVHAHFTGTFRMTDATAEVADRMDVDMTYAEPDLVPCRRGGL